jgi:ribonuclease HI
MITNNNWILTTDGGCLYNGKPNAIGSWAFYLTGPKKIARSGAVKQVNGLPVTNNKTEFLAVIAGLSLVPEGDEVLVVSDSMILINWIERFNKGTWYKNTSMDKSLLEELRSLVSARNVTTEWVKGHNNHPGNEWCDKECARLLNQCAEKTQEPAIYA